MSLIPVGHEWTADKWDWPIQHNDGVVHVHNTPDKFEVGLDVQYFRPDEIEVIATEFEILVNCRHDLRDDEHGTISRRVSRTYRLPEGVDVSTLTSKLNTRGVLVIKAQKSLI